MRPPHQRVVRIPLVTGSEAAQQLLGSATLGAIAGAPLFFATLLPGFMVYPLGVLAALWVFSVLYLPWGLRAARASDVVIHLDERQVVVEGGPHAGKRRSFERALELVPDAGPAPGADEQRETKQELDSQRALAETLAGLHPGHAAVSREEDEAADASGERRAPDVLLAVCAACGARAPASAEESVRCAHCGAPVSMPSSLRERVTRQASSNRSTKALESALADLLRQPGPFATNLLIGIAAVPAVLAWPVGGVLFDEFFQVRGVFSWRALPLLLTATIAFSLCLVWLLRARVDTRRAFALVSLGFHARPPKTPGGAPECGSCGAPLSTDDAHARARAVERCRYCRTDNVRWILLPLRRTELDKKLDDLEAVLNDRQEQRRRDRRWMAGAAVAFVLSLGAGWGPIQTAYHARHARILTEQERPGLLGKPVAAPEPPPGRTEMPAQQVPSGAR